MLEGLCPCRLYGREMEQVVNYFFTPGYGLTIYQKLGRGPSLSCNSTGNLESAINGEELREFQQGWVSAGSEFLMNSFQFKIYRVPAKVSISTRKWNRKRMKTTWHTIQCSSAQGLCVVKPYDSETCILLIAYAVPGVLTPTAFSPEQKCGMNLAYWNSTSYQFWGLNHK